MVAQRILVPFVQVRTLAGQRTTEQNELPGQGENRGFDGARPRQRGSGGGGGERSEIFEIGMERCVPLVQFRFHRKSTPSTFFGLFAISHPG